MILGTQSAPTLDALCFVTLYAVGVHMDDWLPEVSMFTFELGLTII